MTLEPWQHIVFDNFLSKKDLAMFQQNCESLLEPIALMDESNTKGHYRYKYENDPLEAYGIMELFDEFETKRPYEKLSTLVQLVKTCNGANYPIHDDAQHKIFSLVIYLSPEENIGSNFYDSNKKFACKIDWKVNRAIMFCPLDGITYHDYGSTTDRYTLMYNLINK